MLRHRRALLGAWIVVFVAGGFASSKLSPLLSNTFAVPQGDAQSEAETRSNAETQTQAGAQTPAAADPVESAIGRRRDILGQRRGRRWWRREPGAFADLHQAWSEEMTVP